MSRELTEQLMICLISKISLLVTCYEMQQKICSQLSQKITPILIAFSFVVVGLVFVIPQSIINRLKILKLKYYQRSIIEIKKENIESCKGTFFRLSSCFFSKSFWVVSNRFL